VSKSARVLERLIGWASSLKDLRRVLTAALIALIVVYVLQPWGGDVELELVTLWDAWAVSYLGLTGLLVIRSSIQQTRQWALDERIPPRPHLSLLRSVILRVLQVLFLASRTSSLFFIVLVSLVGLVLAISLSPHVRDLETARGVSVVVLDALGVVSAWGVLHISYALHYAYLYYRSEESAGGLAFPGEQNPKQLDFAYFAFTIGTSFAVSDVAVTDPAIRQAVLGHQILSFFYNTSILALVINLVTG
jgi:uncharacterized membrane protein